MGDLAADLSKYFSRIGYDGSAPATIETLGKLQYLHPLAIAYENIDPFMGKEISLDLQQIQRKIIHEGRGGYCFEQNALFMNVLSSLGYSVRGLEARVLWNQPEGQVTARTHMLLLVDLNDEKYIADVGFGGLTQTSPLLLKPGLRQKTTHEPFRVVQHGNGFCVQAYLNEDWRPLYNFELSQQFPADCEIVNYYLSTNPRSRFVRNLIAARPRSDRRYALHNGRLTTYFSTGTSVQKDINDNTEMIRILKTLFGISLPDTEALTRALGEKAALRIHG